MLQWIVDLFDFRFCWLIWFSGSRDWSGDTISLLDPLFRTPGGKTQSISRLLAHSGGIIDMDVSGDVLISCGLVNRSDGSTINDMFVKVLYYSHSVVFVFLAVEPRFCLAVGVCVSLAE